MAPHLASVGTSWHTWQDVGNYSVSVQRHFCSYGNPWTVWQHSFTICWFASRLPTERNSFWSVFFGLNHHLQVSVPDAGIKGQDLRLSGMEYADDCFLLASTAAHLQALIDAMASYCAGLHMQVSIEKTKVMIVGSDRSENFTCNSQPLEQVTSFKYLGLHFHQSGHISHLVTPIIDKVKAAWAIVQQKHAHLQCGDTVSLMFRLLQSILIPTFHHGCEICGMHSHTDSRVKGARHQLESLYLKYMNILRGVPQSTPHDVVLTELNLSRLRYFWCKQTIQSWNGLLSASASSLHRAVLLDNVEDATTHGAANLSSSLCLLLKKWVTF